MNFGLEKHKGFRGQGTALIAMIIGIVIVTVIALALAPTVANSSEAAALNANLTAAGSQLTRLVPLLYVVVIVLILVGSFALSRK